MKLIQLKRPKNLEQNKRLHKAYAHFLSLTTDLEDRQLPLHIIDLINEEISFINRFTGANKVLQQHIKKSTKTVLKSIKTDLNLVPKHYYQNRWMAYGMFVGILLSIILNSLGYQSTWNSLPMALSMGLLFGLLAGKNRDTKTYNMNLQLNH